MTRCCCAAPTNGEKQTTCMPVGILLITGSVEMGLLPKEGCQNFRKPFEKR
jgi:hypothetical protein